MAFDDPEKHPPTKLHDKSPGSTSSNALPRNAKTPTLYS